MGASELPVKRIRSWPECTRLATAAQDAGDYDRALALHRRALQLRPADSLSHSNLGSLLQLLNRTEEAHQHYVQALALDSRHVETLCNLGCLARDQGRLEVALGYFNQAIKFNPTHDLIRSYRGMVRVALGDMDGWDDYEHRLAQMPRPLPEKLRWRGENLAGKTIVVFPEQGIGDDVLHASVLPDLLGQAAKCVVVCSPRLERVYRHSFPSAEVIGFSNYQELAQRCRHTPFDTWCYAGSLMSVFRRTEQSFSKRRAYLSVEENALQASRAKLADGSILVGIAWAGGMRLEKQRERTVPLALWGPLLNIPGVTFVCLQARIAREEMEKSGREIVVTDVNPLGDMADYAALVAAMDLVISVDNTTVHLAAALGVPVWMLTARHAHWRWGSHETTTPWYPTLRMFRQKQQFDWQPVLQNIASELQALSNSASHTPQAA